MLALTGLSRLRKQRYYSFIQYNSNDNIERERDEPIARSSSHLFAQPHNNVQSINDLSLLRLEEEEPFMQKEV
jgi:hypothetical protein